MIFRYMKLHYLREIHSGQDDDFQFRFHHIDYLTIYDRHAVTLPLVQNSQGNLPQPPGHAFIYLKIPLYILRRG